MNTALTSPHPPFIGWQITLLRPGDGRVYIPGTRVAVWEFVHRFSLSLYLPPSLSLSSYMECLNHTAGQYVICLFIQCSNGTRTTYDFDPIIRLLTLLRVIRNTVLCSSALMMSNFFTGFWNRDSLYFWSSRFVTQWLEISNTFPYGMVILPFNGLMVVKCRVFLFF